MTTTRWGADLIDRLGAEALNSAAVNHPYLQAMRTGDFPDVELALKDFALQYGLYSTRFAHYLSAVIEHLTSAEHKRILQANLAEEIGNSHDIDLPPDVLDSVAGQPHASLFQRFQASVGVSASDKPDTTASLAEQQPGALWSQRFLTLCETNQCVGIGAIGIGTELIVSSIYNQILEGLKSHTQLTMQQRVFFDLHSQCDDEHAAQITLITKDLAQDELSSEQIEHGVQMAINLRTEFWDTMLTRARSMADPSSSTLASSSGLGYQTSL